MHEWIQTMFSTYSYLNNIYLNLSKKDLNHRLKITHTMSVIRSWGRTDSVSSDRSEWHISLSEYNSFNSVPSGMMNSFLQTSLWIQSTMTKRRISSHRMSQTVLTSLTSCSRAIPNVVRSTDRKNLVAMARSCIRI